MNPSKSIRYTFRFWIIACLFIALTACGGAVHVEGHLQQRFNNIDRWISIFEDPARDEWQQPDRVVAELNLKSGDVVADIGAGTGYFTRRLARAVAPGGRALGLDVEPGMVRYMEEDARKLGLDNYEAAVVATDDPGLAPSSVDLIFIADTYHHLPDRISYIRRLSEALKPGGRIVIVDFYKKPLPVGPPSVKHKVAKQTVFMEFQRAGYRLRQAFHFLPYQYFLVFSH